MVDIKSLLRLLYGIQLRFPLSYSVVFSSPTLIPDINLS